jgi:serine/threonine protein kinase/tetratricopeptide (TPR) repeat protein
MQLRKLYDLALDHEGEERRKRLEEAAGGDNELVAEVLRLIALEPEAAEFMASSPAAGLQQELSRRQPVFSEGDVVAGKFRVVRLLGQGGMGEVYEASEEAPAVYGRVALKTVRWERVGDGDAQKRLRREALLASGICHPNVCQIHGVVQHHAAGEELSILIMQLLEGRTLSAATKEKRRWEVSEARGLALDMAAALDAAHAAGVIHRDLKPSNVMLTERGAVVMDFGLAVAPFQEGGEVTPLTLSGQILGTPEYMAPEQIRSKSATARSDVYSFGVVLFEMLTGARPGTGATGVEAMVHRVLAEPMNPRDLNSAIPRNWAAVIVRCLERDPAERYGSAGEAMRDLDRPWRLPRLRAKSRRAVIFFSASMSGLLVGYRYWRSATLPGSKLLMTSIENKTGDPGMGGFEALLERQVSLSNRVNWVDRKRVEELRARMKLPAGGPLTIEQSRELALRDGAAGVLSGELLPMGGGLNLRLRLVGVGGAPWRSRWEEAAEFPAASREELWRALGEAARWVRAKAGESAREIGQQDLPAEDVTTSSWEAWQLYRRATERAAGGRLEDAIALLKEAIRYDGSFVMAWRNRADYEIQRQDYVTGYASWARAVAVLDEKGNSSIEAYRTRGMYHEDTGDYGSAEQAYRALLALKPGDYAGRLYLSSVLRKRHRFDEALALVEALASDYPEKAEVLTHSIVIYLSKGRLDLARRDVARLRAAGLTAWADYGEYTVAMMSGDWAVAERMASNLSVRSEPAWRVRGALVAASYGAYRGNWEGSLAAVRLALQRAREMGIRGWMDRLPVWEIYLAWKGAPGELERWRKLFSALMPPAAAPALRVDYWFVAHRLGLRVEAGAAAMWPALPAFRAPRAEIALLAHPSEKGWREVLGAAEELPPHLQQDAYEFAVEMARLHGWPDAALRGLLDGGKPAWWWGNEMNLPGRIQAASEDRGEGHGT